MKMKAIAYWVTTAIIAFELVAGGVTDLVHWQPAVDVLAKLGYPVYLLDILGIWKLLGACVVLAPGLPRLKEWAYAGTVFDLTGAIASSIQRHTGLGDLVVPALFVVCTLASWALRPQDRTFAFRLFSSSDPTPRSRSSTLSSG